MVRSTLQLLHLSVLCVVSSAFIFSSGRHQLHLPSKVRLFQPQALYASSKDRSKKGVIGKNIQKSPIYNVNFRKTGTFPYASKFSISQLAQVLDYELSLEPWFTTGQVNPVYFSKDFIAIDIDGKEYDGIGEYATGMYNQYDQYTSKAQIISCEQSDTNTITVTSRISGHKHSTIGRMEKMVELKAYLQYTFFRICPKSGLIMSQVDRASIPTWDIYLSSSLPVLDRLVSSKAEEEVADRVVKMPSFMKSNNFKLFSGKNLMNKFLAKNNAEAAAEKSAILDGSKNDIDKTKDFVDDRINSKIHSSDESNVGSNDASALNNAVTDYMDALSSGELADFNVLDLNDALSAIERHCTEDDTRLTQKIASTNNVGESLTGSFPFDESINLINLEPCKDDEIQSESSSLGLPKEAPGYQATETIRETPAAPVFSGFAHAYSTETTTDTGLDEDDVTTRSEIPPFDRSINNRETVTYNMKIQGQFGATNIGEKEGNPYFAEAIASKIENENLANSTKSPASSYPKVKQSSSLETLRENVANQPLFFDPKGIHGMYDNIADKVRLENFSVKGVDADKIKDVVLSAGQSLSSMAADIDPETVKNATISSINTLTTIGKGFWSATKFMGKVLSKKPESEKPKSSPRVTDTQAAKAISANHYDNRKMYEDKASHCVNRSSSNDLVGLHTSNSNLNGASGTFKAIPMESHLREIGINQTLDTEFTSAADLVLQNPGMKSSSATFNSSIQNIVSSRKLNDVEQKISKSPMFPTSANEEDLSDSQANSVADRSTENEDSMLPSERDKSESDLQWVENELSRLEADYLELIDSKTKTKDRSETMDKPSKVSDGLPYGPPTDIATGETSQRYVDSPDDPDDAKKPLLSAHDNTKAHQSALESESHILKAHKEETTSSPFKPSSVLQSNTLHSESAKKMSTNTATKDPVELSIPKDNVKQGQLANEPISEVIKEKDELDQLEQPTLVSKNFPPDYYQPVVTNRSSKTSVESSKNLERVPPPSESQPKENYLAMENELLVLQADYLTLIGTNTDATTNNAECANNANSEPALVKPTDEKNDYLSRIRSIWKSEGNSSVHSDNVLNPSKQPSPSSKDSHRPMSDTVSSPLQKSSFVSLSGSVDTSSPTTSTKEVNATTSSLPYNPPAVTTTSSGQSNVKSHNHYDPPSSPTASTKQVNEKGRLPYDPPNSMTSNTRHSQVKTTNLSFVAPSRTTSNTSQKTRTNSREEKIDFDKESLSTAKAASKKKNEPFSTKNLSSASTVVPSSHLRKESFSFTSSSRRQRPTFLVNSNAPKSSLPYNPPTSTSLPTTPTDKIRGSLKTNEDPQQSVIDLNKEVKALSNDLNRLTSAGLDVINPHLESSKQGSVGSARRQSFHRTSRSAASNRAYSASKSHPHHENISHKANDSKNPFNSDSLQEGKRQISRNVSSMSNSYLDDLSQRNDKNPFDNFQP